jgi:hypothetical protein
MPATDAFSRQQTQSSDPYTNAVAVTPSDSTDLTYVSRGIFIGDGGDKHVSVIMQDSGTVVFENVPTGTFLPIRVTRVKSTGTTASKIIAVW